MLSSISRKYNIIPCRVLSSGGSDSSADHIQDPYEIRPYHDLAPKARAFPMVAKHEVQTQMSRILGTRIVKTFSVGMVPSCINMYPARSKRAVAIAATLI